MKAIAWVIDFFKSLIESLKRTYHFQGITYVDNKGRPTKEFEITTHVKWLSTVKIKAWTEEQAADLAIEELNKLHPNERHIMVM